MANKYCLNHSGNWKFRIIDENDSVVLVTYSKTVANICLSAMNNTKEEKITSTNSASAPLCPCCQKDAVYSKAFGWFCNDCGWWTKQRT